MTDEHPVPPYVEPPQEPEPPLETPVPPEIPYVAPPLPTYTSTPSPPVGSSALTGTETLLVVLGSLATTWLVPLVLWLVWKDTEPLKARQAVKIGVLVAVVGMLLWCCILGAIAFGSFATFSSSSTSYSL